MPKLFLIEGGPGVVIDDSDLAFAQVRTWHYAKCQDGRWYAATNTLIGGRHRQTRMHRMLLNPPNDAVVDHINGDTLDNRRVNLRICTISENSQNQNGHIKRKGPYKGLTRYIGDDRWRALIIHHGKRIHLGYFLDPVEAAIAYDRKARELFGEFAATNFDDRLVARIDRSSLETATSRSVCAVCQSEFRPKRIDQAYCTPRCRAKATRARSRASCILSTFGQP